MLAKTKRYAVAAVGLLAFACGTALGEPTRADVLAAMRRATQFMTEKVAYRGGYLNKYTEDLSEQWGEVPARKTMIWVQDPGTVTVGQVFLNAYKATADNAYLQHAKSAAKVLVYGQHPEGGWHYFIDFDPAGVQQWYEEVASKCWGWEEFYHYNGNSTFDDNTTVGAADFLLDLYLTSGDARYRTPLLKALDFIVDAQYPNGGWPQRYPLSRDYTYEGRPDYTSFYTFNDDVIPGNIFFLLKAYRALGDERYRRAALHGMDFVVLAQQGQPQPGWAQQYDMDLNPREARNCEPRALSPPLTAQMVQYLMTFYKATGQTKYLRGIPDALDWLDRATLPAGHSDQGHTHAMFVEIGTDRPLYPHREGATHDVGRYWTDYKPVDILPGYGYQAFLNVDALRHEYERVAALSPEEARREYERNLVSAPRPKPDVGVVQAIIDVLDDRGAWVEDLTVSNYTNYIEGEPRTFRGISVRTFANNMQILIDYVAK